MKKPDISKLKKGGAAVGKGATAALDKAKVVVNGVTGKMTKIEKAVCLIVGVIIAMSIFITLMISIALSSAQNSKTYSDIAVTGVNVLRANVEKKENTLIDIYKKWETSQVAAIALRKGYVASLSDAYESSDLESDVFCLFADVDGKKQWASDNYKLADFDMKAIADGDIYCGLYTDENIPLCYIYAGPVIYGGPRVDPGDKYSVGACVLGFNLSSNTVIEDVKKQIGCELTLFSGSNIASTTFTDAESLMSEKIAEKLLNDGEAYSAKMKVGGSGYYVQYEPFYDYRNQICGAYCAAQDSSEGDAASNKLIMVSVIAALVIIIVSFIVVVYFMKKVVARPIVEVSKLAESMSRGELNIPDFEYKFGDNEVGEFARSLQTTKHRLGEYINDISTVIDKMAEGDFTVRPTMKYRGDFVRIERSFALISENLSGIVRSINASSEQVLTGSAQMANGSQILADGTTRQADAVERLNYTVQAINEKTEINASNARRAKLLSAQMEESAIDQNKEMDNVMEAMRDIENKSSQIGNIIRTIEDIAFQTNILALNAAVEAARAGDAGQGFAVVADEVRTLASMSAEAAQDTTNLISATVIAVNSGFALVDEASRSMEEITEKAKETSRLVDAISEASNTQAEAVRQIVSGIEQISEVVQQNSATAEQTAASCEQLSGQSQILRNQVGKLKA